MTVHVISCTVTLRDIDWCTWSSAFTRSWTLLCEHARSSSCEGGRSSAERSQGSMLVFYFQRYLLQAVGWNAPNVSMFLMFSSRHVKGGYELFNPLT